MYVIYGGTGNTGKPLALSLLEQGKKVRILTRDANKATELSEKGAEILTGDTSDVNFLTTAFTGATAVYVMIPQNWATNDLYSHQQNYVNILAEAIEKSGVKYAVTLSSVGANLESGSGVVLGLHYMEQKFNSIAGLNVLHLRPTYFLENLLSNVGIIKNMGIAGSPVIGDLKMCMIATKDIGNYAAKRLAALDFSGSNVQYLLGERDLTMNEVTKILGNAIGKPDLQYVQFSFDDFKKGFVGMGAPENLADLMSEFINTLNNGNILAGVVRDSESTTPTSIEEFSKVFAYIFNN